MIDISKYKFVVKFFGESEYFGFTNFIEARNRMVRLSNENKDKPVNLMVVCPFMDKEGFYLDRYFEAFNGEYHYDEK